MRVAVVSDIHGNLPALEAGRDRRRRPGRAVVSRRPRRLWAGAERGHRRRPRAPAVCLVGSHDLVGLGSAGVDVDEFNPEAAEAALWTRRALSTRTREFLDSLEPQGVREGIGLYHATPRAPVWEYGRLLNPGAGGVADA